MVNAVTARRPGLCAYCAGPVYVGSKIALVGGLWLCLACAAKVAEENEVTGTINPKE